MEKMQNSPNDMQNIIKPNRKSFMFFGLFFWFLILLVLLAIGSIFVFNTLDNNLRMVFGLVFVALFGIVRYWISTIYMKTEYEFFNEKITIRSGSPISETSTDIDFERITALTMRLGFWEQIFFKTGSIQIATGGMGVLTLQNLSEPQNIFEKIQDSMRQNGFHLKQDELVQDAKPHKLAIFMEILSAFGGILVFLVYFGASIATSFTRDDSKAQNFFNFYNEYNLYIWLVIGIIVISMLVSIALKYMDLSKRKYRIFKDSIVYEEGFLTKYTSILPMEKVSDTDNKQGFFAKIFGFHDIIVSSEWSGNRVIFKNMIEGEKMLANIKFLKNSISLLPKNLENSGEIEKEKENDVVGYKNVVDKPFVYNSDFIGNYKMHFARSLIGAIIGIIFTIIFVLLSLWAEIGNWLYALIVIIPIIIANARQFMMIFFTDFIVTKSTIEKKFSLFSNHHTIFSVDKITRIDIARNPIDYIFGTASVIFSSIGSSDKIIFRHIKYDENLEKNLLEKIGIFRENSEENPIEINFSLKEFFKSNFFIALFIVTIPFLLLVFIWKKIYYSKRFYENFYSDSYVGSRAGVIFQTKIFSLFEYVKWVRAMQNIFSKTGDLSFAVAANVQILSDGENRRNQEFLLSPRISMDYVANIFEILDFFDVKLSTFEVEESRYEPILRTPRSLKNSLIIEVLTLVFIAIILIVLSVFEVMNYNLFLVIFNFIVISALLLVYLLFSIRNEFYEIQNTRMVKFSGIFYKTRETILFEKINFINKNQGFIGKICKNGNVEIFTLASEVRDMVLSDMDNYLEMYKILQEKDKEFNKK